MSALAFPCEQQHHCLTEKPRKTAANHWQKVEIPSRVSALDEQNGLNLADKPSVFGLNAASAQS
jgi:hypothetical protein